MNSDKKKAFTLIEVLVTLAIILILVGALVGTGKYLRTRAERQLTRSAIEVICTALEQYYDQTKSFPPPVSNQSDLKTALAANAVTVSKGVLDSDFWQSGTVYYFLSRVPQSRAIVESLAERMISNKDSNGNGVQIQIQISSGGTVNTYDWVRFVDTWGTSLRYEYMDGYSFPKTTSAGPDKKFDTKDDLSSQ